LPGGAILPIIPSQFGRAPVVGQFRPRRRSAVPLCGAAIGAAPGLLAGRIDWPGDG